eukprot:8943187-Pyramimonas_sp.AAC.1
MSLSATKRTHQLGAHVVRVMGEAKVHRARGALPPVGAQPLVQLLFVRRHLPLGRRRVAAQCDRTYRRTCDGVPTV